MATNRQSLKNLQERLAQRLAAAKSEAATASWLAVEAGDQRYLVPLVQSGEIFPWTTVQAVPYTKPWYRGVASLRGGLHGVVDWQQFVGHAPVVDAERVTSESRLVSLHAALGVNAVLWVDRLLGLRNPAMFSAMAPRPPHAPACFTRCLIDHQGLVWQELDLQVLASDPDFLTVAA